MKKGFWSSDWFVGLVFTFLFLLVARGIAPDGFQRLETAAYDWGLRAAEATPNDRIAIVDIDDRSIEGISRWPWSRELHAAMIERLKAAGAKVIAEAVFFTEPQQDVGAAYIKELVQFYDGSTLGAIAPAPVATTGEATATDDAAPAPAPAPAAASAPRPAPVVPLQVKEDLANLRGRLGDAALATDTDAQLAEHIRAAGNVVLPTIMEIGEVLGRPDGSPPEYVLAGQLGQVAGDPAAGDAFDTLTLTPPIPVLGEAAASLGHLTMKPDVDGAVRYETLVLRHGGAYYPSFALAVAAKALNLRLDEDVTVTLGAGVQLGRLAIETTPDMEMYNFFYGAEGGRPAFNRVSFYDVFTDAYPAANFKDKIVLIGASAAGVGDTFATPVDPVTPPVVMLAHTVSSILEEDFFTRPAWAGGLEFALLALLAVYLCIVLPRLKPTLAVSITLGLVAALVAVELMLMSSQRLWFQFMVPVAFLLSGHLLITVKRFNVTEALKAKSETEGAESNKMLGLALQGQGQLDMAFEKFRKLPKEPATLDLLYNLALDFERKRQHNKALGVYQDIAQTDPNYKDVQTRLKRAKQLEETVILGGGGSTMAGTMILDTGDVQKPMLGRYEVEKELGKGAMGVVYLGKDPKINRTVAIKTMALGQEFEADELADAKERFFREAETAGRLNHPHIVTIYDAGEEHDLCYIAMEFLKGKDLTRFVKAQSLLPAEKVFRVIADAADALDYAHQNGVVHRDIKPANLMYEDDSGLVKITDFGIARITDSSKTKTGLVLGTPSYMSPEQLSGKKVDGRSDLFSLGVTFYQLLTGQLPFQAESMATLMYKIANDKHAPLGVLRPDLPPAIEPLIDRALAKDPDQRYARGADLARDVRACAAQLAKA